MLPRVRIFCLVLLVCSFFAFTCNQQASAQSSDAVATRALVTSKVDDSKLVSYKSSVPAEVKAAEVQGHAAASMVMEGQIVLHRAPEMQIAVDLLQERLRTKGDPLYHQWLTGKELAAEFGPAQSDITALETWMASHGLTVTSYQPAQLVVLFNGPVASVEEAFHTQIFEYTTADGATHYSNATNPKVPEALDALILSPLMLNNFTPIPMQNFAGEVVGAVKSPSLPKGNVIVQPKEPQPTEPEGLAHPDTTALTTFTFTDTPGTQNQGTSTAQTLTVTLTGTAALGTITGTLTITNPTLGTIESVANVATGCSEGATTHAYTCTFTWNPSATLAAGDYILTANYGGNAAYSPGTSTATFMVDGSTTTTTTDTANPTLVDGDTPPASQITTITSTTTWTGNGPTPTGTVTLSCGPASAGTCELLPAPVTVNSTNCTINTTAKTFSCPITYQLDGSDTFLGTYFMVMTYSGDATYAASASTANPAQVIDSVGGPVGITITPSPVSVVQGAGTSVTYTVTLTNEDNIDSPFTGTLTFSGTPLTTSPVVMNLSSCYQSVNAVATCTITSAVPVAMAVGNYTLTAAYSGDVFFKPFTGTGTLAVTGAASTSMTSSATPTIVDNANPTTTITSVTTWTGSGATPTGTVSLSCGPGSPGICLNLPAAQNVSACSVSTTAKTITCTFASYNLVANGVNHPAPASVSEKGTYNMLTVYSGDANYTGSSSSTPVIDSQNDEVGVTVSPSPASVALGSGASVTYTVTLLDEVAAGATFTGTLSLSGTPLTTSPVVVNLNTCSQTISSFQEIATCAITSAVPAATAIGNYTVTASYSGDGNYAPATGTGTVRVDGTTATSMTSSATPTTVFPGTKAQMTTTVTSITTWTGSGATPTGTVSLTCGTPSAGICNTLPAAKNVSTCTISTTAKTITCKIAYELDADDSGPGAYTLVSTYCGDSTYAGSSSSVVVIDMDNDSSTVAVSSSPSSVPQGAGTSVTYTVTLTSAVEGAQFTGTLSLSGTPLTTSPTTINLSTCSQTENVEQELATCTITSAVPAATASGSYTLTAAYSGDDTYKASTGTGTLVVTGSTATSMTSSANPTLVNPAVQTTTVTSVTTWTGTGATPTGTVTLSCGNPSAGTCSALPAAKNVSTCTISTSAKTITCAIPYQLDGNDTALGAYTLVSAYSGDTTYLGASSSVTVNDVGGTNPSTTTVVAAPTSVNFGVGTSVTYTASVVGIPGGAGPTGSVSFSGTPITGAPLIGPIVQANCTTSGTGASVVFACPVVVTAVVPAATVAGTYTIAAAYSGGVAPNGSSYEPSSGTTTLTVTIDATATSVSANPSSIAPTASTLLTATVTNTTAPAVTPTGGTVTFTDTTNSASLGSCTLSAGTCNVTAQGSAMASGANTVMASYAGVTNEFGASSSTTTVTVVVANPNVITFTSVSHNFGQVAVGTAATAYGVVLKNTSTTTAYPFVVDFTPANGFTALTNCPASLAAGASCNLQFNFTPTATGPVSATWSLATENGFSYTPSNGGTLQGSGTSQGGVSLTTNGHNFGTVAVGTTSATYGTELSNSTTSAETISLGTVSAPFAMVTNCGTTLAVGASCEIEFTYAPTTTSPVSVVVPLSGTPTAITSGGAALPSGGITLSGN